MKYNSYTKKNTKYKDKPNEDKIIIKNNLFIILDGVSRSLENNKYPNPSPAKEVAKIAANTIKKYIKENEKKEFRLNPKLNEQAINTKLIRDALKEANKIIHDYNIELNDKHKAGCVGIVMLIRKDYIYYTYIGDCVAICIDKKNQKHVLTRRQTEEIAKHHNEFTADEIRNVICNNFSHPYGYGVIDGDMRAVKFFESKIIKNNLKAIILSTDGMYNYLINEDTSKLLKLSSRKMINDKSPNNDDNDDKSIIKIIL